MTRLLTIGQMVITKTWASHTLLSTSEIQETVYYLRYIRIFKPLPSWQNKVERNKPNKPNRELISERDRIPVWSVAVVSAFLVILPWSKLAPPQLCYSLSRGIRTPYFLLVIYWIHALVSFVHTRTFDLWTMETWKIWCCYQHHLYSLFVFYMHFYAFPIIPACDSD